MRLHSPHPLLLALHPLNPPIIMQPMYNAPAHRRHRHNTHKPLRHREPGALGDHLQNLDDPFELPGRLRGVVGVAVEDECEYTG